ncbi:MAG: pyruvate dehydrogenase E2 component (dihydrolipoamide acetyltransferase) [Oceanicoccus sp.]|jgi:pyruvate dehydrogenase E2 component (dihydrolipoamide acetyltransferase)
MYALAIPKWGIEMESGTVAEWHSDVGDTVNKGDELVDIESDKIVNTLEATATGVLRRKFAETDDKLVVGELIGVIADAETSDEAIDTFVAEFNAAREEASNAAASAEVANSPAAAPAPQAAPPAVPAGNTSGKVRVSPPVKRKAKQLGIDIDTVAGSGPGGRITLDDVERAASSSQVAETSNQEPSSQESAAEKFTATKLSPTQQTIGRRLVESKQTVPHFYLCIDIELDVLLAKRAEINSQQSQKVSINDMIVWCTARALKAVPKINAQLVGDEIRQFEHADISVAVATERGLFTPVVKAADQMTPVEVATAIAGLVDKAKDGNLQRSDIDGGSFTISNLGMYGVKSFDAIINTPQVAILSLGRAQKQIVVRDNSETTVATIITASLSSDHRVVDGALGGTFLSTLKREIESLD